MLDRWYKKLTRSKQSMLFLYHIDAVELYCKRLFCALSCGFFQSKCNDPFSLKSNFSKLKKASLQLSYLIIFEL